MVGADKDRGFMAAVAVGEGVICGIEDGAEEGGELAGDEVSTKHEVEAAEEDFEFFVLFGIGAEGGAEGSHGQGGGYAFSHDVADGQDEAFVGQEEVVIEVAADLVAGDVEAGEIDIFDIRKEVGDEVSLDIGGDFELAGHVFGFEGFGVEAGIDDGGGGLGGDGLGGGDIGRGKKA